MQPGVHLRFSQFHKKYYQDILPEDAYVSMNYSQGIKGETMLTREL